jgi:hypothetical protein
VNAAGDPTTRAAPSAGSRTGPTAWLALAAALVLAHVAHRGLLGLEHFGWDTYPLIVTSRVSDAGDVVAAFTQELMHGRYPLGSFYRPVTSLAFALDHALWGIEPFGFHLTNHLITLAGVVLAFLLARRLVGGALAPAIAALVVALHPIHLALLPIAARRADMLSALFTMATLVALPRCDARARPLRLVATFVLAWAAAASKETGIVALPLVLGLAWVESRGAGAGAGGARDERAGDRSSAGDRGHTVLRRAGPAALAVLLFVLCRTIVLGGIGGHDDTSIGGALAATPRLALAYANLMVAPRPPLLGPWSLAALAAALALAVSATRARTGRAALFCAGWLVVLAGVTGLAGEVRTWYGAPFLPLYAAACAVAAAGWSDAIERRRPLAGLSTGGVLLFLVLWPLRSSALVRDYDEWPFLSRWEREFLDEAHAALAAAEPGTVARVETVLPRAVRSDLHAVRSVGLELYSVQAWADLAYPELAVRIAVARDDTDPVAAPHEVVLQITDRPARRR